MGIGDLDLNKADRSAVRSGVGSESWDAGSAADRKIKLRQLQCFVAVVESNLNISAASRHLHTAQPGVSRQLQALEDSVGAKLFKRSGRRICALTEHGEIAFTRAKEVLRMVRGLGSIGTTVNEHNRTLHVCVAHNLASFIAQAKVIPFLAENSAVRVRMLTIATSQIPQLVEEGAYNVGITTETNRRRQPSWQGVESRPCFRWRYRFVCDARHPLAQRGSVDPEEIGGYPLVTCSNSLAEDFALYEPQGRAAGLNAYLTVADESTVKACVSRLPNSLGVIIQPEGITPPAESSELGAGLRFLEVQGPAKYYDAYVCLLRDSLQNQLIADFVARLGSVSRGDAGGFVGDQGSGKQWDSAVADSHITAAGLGSPRRSVTVSGR